MNDYDMTKGEQKKFCVWLRIGLVQIFFIFYRKMEAWIDMQGGLFQ